MPSILVIDDDELFRATLVEALMTEGYAVTQADDGDVGVKLFKTQPTDLVLTDIVMPNQEGIATVRELRRASPRLGIIAMSGGAAKDAPLYLELAGGLGADRTLQKPFPLAVLLATVKEVLAKHAGTSPLPPLRPKPRGRQ